MAGFFGGDINGVRYSIGFGIFRFSATSLMMFYIPIYGAILYHYRNGGVAALLKSIDLADDSGSYHFLYAKFECCNNYDD